MIAGELPRPPAGAKTGAGSGAISKKLYFITDLWYILNINSFYYVICGETART
jgi:hypothetical protein